MSGARICPRCGLPYYRINVTRVWDELSGHREGNRRTEEKACTNCRPPEMAQRLLATMGMYTLKKKVVRIAAAAAKKKRKKKSGEAAA